MPICAYIRGDIVDVIRKPKLEKVYFAHGCNCEVGVMGSGVAKSLADVYSQILVTDINHTNHQLGSYSITTIDSMNEIINLYTQKQRGRVYTIDELYQAIEKGFSKLNQDFRGETIYIPKIGAGNAGGDWTIISDIIDRCTPNLTLIVVTLTK